MQWFLVKVAGSNGCIYDFSRASVENTDNLRKMIEPWCTNPDTAFIKYSSFDERIGFHVWHLMANTKHYGPQHMVWIYSQSDKRPCLSEDFNPYYSSEEIQKETERNIPFTPHE